MDIFEVSGSVDYPVTVDNVKDQGIILISGDDSYISGALIPAAIQMVEQYTDYKLTDHQYDVYLNANELTSSVLLPFRPYSSVSGVWYYDVDNTEAEFTDYTMSSGTITQINLNYGSVWPSTPRSWQSLRVRYNVGYQTTAEVPQSIVTATAMVAVYLYEHRGDEDSPNLPILVKQLLSPYRKLSL